MSDYPNREHENADKAARRCALKALDGIESEMLSLRRRLTYNDRNAPDGDETQRIAALTRDLIQHLSILGALREVREWHAADLAERDLGNGGEANE